MKPLVRTATPQILFGLLLCFSSNVTVAQQPSQAQTSAIRQSCRADYQSNCANVPTAGSAALQCLQQHQAALSPACQTAVAAVGGGAARPPPSSAPAVAPSAGPPAMSMRQQMGMMRNACSGDYRAYCRGVGLGGGRAMACLAANENRLSPPCKGALAEARGSR
jgi:hypothetical protein